MSEEKVEIGFTFDPGLISVFGARKYSTYMEALNEIVRNSIGYRAKKIDITISTDKIIVEDDGIGMNKEGLQKEYFRVGKPTKDATTGSLFGIGKFGNQALAHKTEIITQKQGSSEKFHVSIDWDEAEKAKEIDALHPQAYRPNVKKTISSPKKHGTTIILTDLKYQPQNLMEFKNYTEKKLFPLLITDKIRILINGQRCVATEPKGQCFEFDTLEDFILEDKTVSAIPEAPFGKVWGEFYVTDPDDSNTTHVYDSFGHRLDSYSERDWLRLTSFTSAMAFKKRLVGIIHTTTEEIRDENIPQKCLILKSDRSGFFEETPSYKEMVKYVKKIVKLIHEKWLKEYKDVSSKIIKIINEESPIVAKIVENILSETERVWKREDKGVLKTVVRKQRKGREPKPTPTPKHKMLQCSICKAINYITLVEYRVFVENPNEDVKKKMLKNWPCKVCGHYLNPEADLYKRKAPSKKPGFIATKVKLGPGRSIEIQPEPLGRAGALAYYDPDTEYLAINTDHTFLTKASEMGYKGVRQHMVLSALYAVAQMRKREENAEFETEFNKLCSFAHHWTGKGEAVRLIEEKKSKKK